MSTLDTLVIVFSSHLPHVASSFIPKNQEAKGKMTVTHLISQLPLRYLITLLFNQIFILSQ